MAVFNRILSAQLKVMIMGWTLAVFGLLFFRLTMASVVELREISSFLLLLGFLFSILLPKTFFYQQRYFSLIKLTSRNIKQIWSVVALQNIILLFVSLGIWLTLSQLARAHFYSSVSVWEKASYPIVAFLAMMIVDSNQLIDRARHYELSKKNIALRMAQVFFMFGCFYLLFKVYSLFSPLSALFILNALLLFDFLFASDEMLKTFTQKAKWKVFFIGTGIIFVGMAVLGWGDYRYSRDSSFIVARVAQWKFSDINNVKSLEDWIYWQNKLKSLNQLTADQLIQSYEKLHQYCPPKHRDDPLSVECFSKLSLRDYQFTGVDAKSEEEVLTLLSASTEYSQIMGILYARKLKKPLSRELITAIEYIADKEGNLRGMARNTLVNSYPENYKNTLVIKADPSFQ